MIKRAVEQKIRESLDDGKVLVIYGARQVGKTTLLHQIFDEMEDVLWLNGDEKATQDIFRNFSAEKAKTDFREKKVLIIDEAQRVEDIGLKLKIIHDNFGKDLLVVATGSSSFDLANKINEPLTGRMWEFQVYPLSAEELVGDTDFIRERSNLETRMVYGCYPEVVTSEAQMERVLGGIVGGNLYKDVLNLGEVIKTDRLQVILEALALQVGQQVSMNELGQLVGLDRKTVDKYIALLEQAFVIFRLRSYSSNLRSELKKSQKIYFYDNGVRNALLGNYLPVEQRSDVGALFENYMVAELRKMGGGELFDVGSFHKHQAYFWRTKDGQEVDYVAVKNTQVSAVEMKWNERRTVKFPKSFVDKYNPVETKVVNRGNYLEEILGEEGLRFLK